MSKAKSATVLHLHLLRPARRLCAAVLTRRRPLGTLASLVAAAVLSMGLAAWLLWPSGPVQAQGGEPSPVENLRCTVRTDVVAFFWEKPQWSGGEVNSYGYQLTMPDGRTEGGQFYKSYTSAVRWGSYESGQETRFSITANYETADGRTVASAEAELTCWVGGEPRPANQAPTVASALSDATIVNESGTHQVSLSGVFDDADGDDLTVTAVSSNDAAATVSVSADYASLTVTARDRGTATITATADDGNGGTVDEVFTVTVKAAPVVASALPDVADLAEDSTQEVSLSGVFTDADGDSLTVSAASSNNGVARVLAAVDGSKLMVAAVAEGAATVTVTAEDSDGNRVSDTFDVTVAAAQQQQQQLALSSDATLGGLAVHRASSNQPDAGDRVPYAGPAYQLTPALTDGVYDYRVRVPELRPDEEGPFYVTTVATTAASGAGSIVVSGKGSTEETRDPKREVATGEASGPWQTFVGHGLITIVVTSLDGNSVQTYRVLVEQGRVDDPQGVAVAPGDGQLTLSWDEATGSNAPELYWARWREAGTTNWLNRATLSGWKTSYGDDAADGTAADGQRMPSSGRSYVITGLTNGTEYEVELRGTRGGDTGYGVTNWLKSGWTAARGTPGQPAVALTITPGSPTREYGGTDDLGYAVGGLAAGDAAGDVVTGSLSRAPGEDAGSYAISMGTLAIAPAYAEKYTLPSAPAVATYTITPRAITAVSGVTVDSRPADGSATATFDTSAAQGVGVLAAELLDFQAGGLAVSGSFPAATPGTHDLSVTYSLQDHGAFKAANYTLSAATDTLQGVLTEVAACGSGLMLFAQGTPAEGGSAVTVTAGLSSPAGPDGVAVTLTTGGTATLVDDYTLSTTTVNIAAGATAGVSTITIVDDAVDDDDETVILNAAVSDSSLIASPLTLTIIDNDGAPALRRLPVKFTQISAGAAHTCGVKADDQALACWGYNVDGRATPPGGAFKQVSAGGSHTCGVKTDDTVACWGSGYFGQATPPGGAFKQVSAGDIHTCGVKTDDTVACWGTGYSGQATPPGGAFKQVSAGINHTCGVESDDTVACWGNATYGHEGRLPGGTFKQISAGPYHTCGVRASGTIVCWGHPPVGRLPPPRLNFSVAPPSGTFKQVSGGSKFACALKANDHVACWGDNSNVRTAPTETFTQIDAGGHHACGLRTDGEVVCWGSISHGRSTPPETLEERSDFKTPNRAPTVSNGINDITIVNESGNKELSLLRVFSDADNDVLTITAASSDEAVATASVSSDNPTLMNVSAQARGRATITVASDDGRGGTVEDTFTVTVKAAPVVAVPLDNVTGLEVGTTREVSLSGVFSDPDGDALKINGVGFPALVRVAFGSNRSLLRVTGVVEGTGTIDIDVYDADGNWVSEAFEVEVVQRYAALIANMYQWRNDPRYVSDKAHTDRWDRALLAFGETVVDTTLTPMPASEAQGYADRGWTRWVEVAAALREIEAG